MIVKEGETLDMKSLGPNTVGLIKQNRKGKLTFQGKYPLVKFGMFADSSEASESHESSDRITSEDDVDLSGYASLFDSICDVAHLAIKIRDTKDVLETMPPTSTQMTDTTTPMETTLWIPLLRMLFPLLSHL